MIKVLISLTILFHLVIQLNGQVPDTLMVDSLKVKKLEEVEVKAMYSNILARRFPATVYALSVNENNIVLPVNINESLNQLPSVYAHTGTYSTSRITMRGIGTRSLYGTRKINALLNDIPLTSGEGDTFIDDIDLQFIDQIEIVGGPTAGIYGPALGGTLLLYTHDLNKKNSFKITSGIGSFGTFQNALSAEVNNGEMGISLIYKNVNSDGYRANNTYNRNSALLNYYLNLKRTSWNVLALYTDVRAGIPSSIDSISFEENPRTAATNWAKTNGREDTKRFLAGLTHHYTFSNNLSSSFTLYGLYKKSLEVRPFDFLYEDDVSGGLKLNFKKKFSQFEGLSLTPGLSFFLEKYTPSLYENLNGTGEKGNKNAENVEDIFHANAFLITEYAPNGKNFVSISLNVNKFEIDDRNIFALTEKQKYQQNLNFSPRVSLSRQIRTNHFVFGSISHGLSYPSIQEILYPDGTINNDVKPEKAWSYEAGLKGTQLFNEFKYSVAFYYMPVKDLIVPERIAEDTYIGKNIGKSLHKGLEISIVKALPKDENQSWFYLSNYRLTFNLQSNKFQDFYIDTLDLEGRNLPGVPERRFFLNITFMLKNWFYIEPEIYMNGKTAMNDENSKYYNAYNISNLHFGFIYKNPNWNLRLSSGINNVFDEKYASMILINAPSINNRPPRYYYPGQPRNFNLSVSIEVKI